MKGTRLVTAGGVLGLVGLALMPASAGASDQLPHGKANAATLQLQVAPSAILGETSSALSALQSTGLLAQIDQLTSDLTVQLDEATSQATLTADHVNLTQGHSLSLPLDVKYAPLDPVFNLLNGQVLNNLNSLSSLTSSLTGALGSTGTTLTTTINQLNLLQTQLGDLGSLNLNLQKSAEAALNWPNVANNPYATSAGVTLTPGTNVLGLGTINLAPFTAETLDLSNFASHNESTPVAKALNTTEHLSIAPKLNLSALTPDLLANLNNLVSTLTNLANTLTSEITSLTSNPTVSNVVSTICNNPVTSTLGSATGSTDLLGTVVGTATGNTTTTCTSTLSGTVSSSTVNLSALTGLLSNIKLALPDLSALNTLANLLGGLDLGSLLSTDGVTATSAIHPTSSHGLDALSTASFVDVTVGGLSQNLTNTINSILGSAGVPALPSGTALLKLNGANTSAHAALPRVAAPSATSHLTSLTVLGQTISLDKVIAPGTSQVIPVAIPGLGQLTAIVSAGVPQVVADTATDQHIRIAALDVSILNGDQSGANAITLLGGKGAKLVDLAVAPSEAQVSMTPVSVTSAAPAPAGCTGQACFPNTGMFGAPAMAVAGLLGAAGFGLRLRSRRRRGAVRADS